MLKDFPMNISEARKLLGSDYENVSDEEIQILIDMMKKLCQVVVNDYSKEKKEG